MLDSYSNNVIAAKARGMYGKHITKEEYEELLRCRSVSEVASYLKTQTHYREALENVNPANIHRGQLENMLRREAFEEYSKMYRYLNAKRENLFHYVIMEEEIVEILRMVLLLKADNAESFIMDLPAYLIAQASVDLMAVARVHTYDELIGVLKGTDYAAILERFHPTKEVPTINYVACEHAFYEYFFKRYFAMMKKNYKGRAGKELEELLLTRIELMNLTSIYRTKVFFGAKSSTVARRLYPYRYKLKEKQVQDMIGAPDKESLERVIASTAYSRQLAFGEYPYIENYTDRLRYRISRKYLHFSTSASVVFLAYFTLSQLELNNIVSIIEGIRYQESAEDIRKLLIL